jgi:uncharacterized protein YlxP (DUF503 family)
MVVGVLRLRMLVRGAHSLKDKRRVLKSLKDRLGNRFNVSVAEVGELDHHQCFELGVAAVGNDRRYLNGLLSSVVKAAAADGGAELLDYTLELN